jgi:molybdopterin synthase sulfur carrier subunit
MRQFTGGADTISVEASTVADALNLLVKSAPGIEVRLFKAGAASPTLNRFINVYVNDEDIRFLENLDTPVKPGDAISIVPAIAGG